MSPSYNIKTNYCAKRFLLKVEDVTVLSALLCASTAILILPFWVVKPLVNVSLEDVVFCWLLGHCHLP